LLGAVTPAQGPRVTTVLMLPLEAHQGASKETAEVLTQMMAAEGSRYPAFKVVSFREVEGTMSQEQVRQVSGCASNTCAAEIAGALNTDEIVLGSFTKVGATYVLTASRVRARDAEVVGRISERFTDLDDAKVLDRLPSLMKALLDGGAVPAPPAPVQKADDTPAPTRSRLPMLGLGVGTMVGGGVALVVALATAGLGALAFLPWVITVPTGEFTGIPRAVVFTSGPWILLATAAVLLLVAVGLGAAGLGVTLWRGL
jgi:hypothetical protein